ncbi:gtp-binding protein ypt1 [Anaeramoeba ignava]|uniref:Gtp-binding protein ypt1 n=1 Tax=Anaeramoeba ignava TaxID=1746090 RepID=A0A9Q0RFA2_ANAIG|nr:gtp-binding protein ypt1 [Anaeramoeba ignava]
MSFHFMFKIVIIGAAGVGKTSLIDRYVDNTFNFNCQSTIGVDFKTKDVEIEGKIVRLQIWDTAGQERFQISFSSSIYKNADIDIVVFDLTNEESLNKIGSYLKEIENNTRANPLIAIVGNKSDLIEEQIENVEERINEILKGRELKLFKTSAKDGTNVNELFYEIAKTFKENQPKHHLIANIDFENNDFENNDSENIVLEDIVFENPERQNSKSKKCC